MVQKVKAIVRIAGREYTIRGKETEEYIHSVAIHVNRKMEEIIKVQPGLSTAMAAVLTALNLGDEVLKLKQEVKSLQAQVDELEAAAREAAMPPAQSNANSNPKPPNIYDVSRKGKR